MIVLRKVNVNLVEKTIQPGNTEEFFSEDLDEYEAFDWNVKILSDGQRGITKISSLFNGVNMESTTYAFLGKRFNTVVSISATVNDYCEFKITNNESLPMRCSVKLKTF